MNKSKFSIHAKSKTLLPVVFCLSVIFTLQASGNDIRINELTADRASLLSIQNDTDTICREVFYIVQEMPTFQRRLYKTFKDWLAENTKYPPQALRDSITGKVSVQFVVNRIGKVVDVIVIEGVHPLLDAEAIRVTKSSPAWEPGKQWGKKVCVQFTFPINFVLE